MDARDSSTEATTFFITGAGRGIGLELTRQALARGDRVIATCRRPEVATELHSLGAAHPESLRLGQLDICSTDSAEALLAEFDESTIDVLINNAGVYGGDAQSLTSMDYGAWAETLAVNTLAPFRVATTFLPMLGRSPTPRIVTLSSEMGSLAGTSTGEYAYRASKAAVNKVMQVLAEELRSEGIVVVPVHPGWVRTDMGGPNAPVSVHDSVRGLLALIDSLTLQDSGRFLAWDGTPLAW